MSLLHLNVRSLLGHLIASRAELAAWLGIPVDQRGTVLACGFIAAAGLGVAAISDRDPIGWAYVALAACGYLFLQTRLMPALLWSLIAGLGVWAALAGAPGAWVQVVFAITLTVISLTPPAEGQEVQPILTQVSSTAEQAQPNLKPTSADAEESLPQLAISIYSLGRFQALVGVQDWSAQILDRPTTGGLWLYLLALAVANPEASVSRATLAAQVSTGHSRRQQRDRFRRLLWDVQHDLGPLGALVVADRWSVRLDLSKVVFDGHRLHRLHNKLTSTDSPVTPGLLLEVRDALQLTAECQFLPDFERLAAKCGLDITHVRRAFSEARSRIHSLRGEVAQLLAAQPTPVFTAPAAGAIEGESS